MVVNAATKMWLMDNGLDQHTAHLWADGKTRKELLEKNFNETMYHLYWNCFNRQYVITDGKWAAGMIDKETFFRDGPPKDIGFYPFTMNFRDMIGKDIRYDDYIYQYIRGVKQKDIHRHYLPTSEYLNLITVWGKKDKKENPFINYDELPWGEK